MEINNQGIDILNTIFTIEVNLDNLDIKLSEVEDWDSISALGLMAAADQELNIIIDPDEMESATTIRDLFNLLKVWKLFNDKEVYDLIASVLKVEPSIIDDNLAIGDIPEWDSVNNIRLIQAIEEKYNINIDVSDAIEAEDVYDFKNLIKKYIS